jgi:hypothetical protein
MTDPTVPDCPLTVPKGSVTATVPTVPSPPIGGTVGQGTVSRPTDDRPHAHRPPPHTPLLAASRACVRANGHGPVPGERSR